MFFKRHRNALCFLCFYDKFFSLARRLRMVRTAPGEEFSKKAFSSSVCKTDGEMASSSSLAESGFSFDSKESASTRRLNTRPLSEQPDNSTTRVTMKKCITFIVVCFYHAKVV